MSMYKSQLRKIFSYALPYRKMAGLNVVFNLLYAVFNVMSILVFIPTLGILFGTEERVTERPTFSGMTDLKSYVLDNLSFFLTQKTEEEGPVSALVLICILSIGIFFMKNLFRYLAMYVLTFLRTGMVKDLQDHLYEKVLQLPLGYFSEQRKGDLMARMTADVKEVEISIINSLESLVREPITIVIVLFTMLSLSWELTLFVFLFLPVAGFLISAVGKRLKAQSLQAQKEQGMFLSFLEETLGSLKVVKGFTAEAAFLAKFRESTSRFAGIMTSVLKRKGLASPFSEFLGVCVVICVLWFGGRLVLSEESSLTPQQFIGYIGLFYTVIAPVKAITTVNYGLRKGLASSERIFDILEAEESIVESGNTEPVEPLRKSLALENVSFSYDGKEQVINNLSLELHKGKMLALIGPSGSGKSTVANLLMRFYDVNEGRITFDDRDIRNIPKESLRSQISVVTQDSILFNDTVRNNIALGRPGASEEEILDAARIAFAHDFIRELPEGYDTVIGDGGGKLSGGQKQRISIARAVLKNAPVLILDEATSALDTESEKYVQLALEKMMENRTSLVIAHRLSTIQKADTIAVMDRGRIVETGNHSGLMKKDSQYRKLVELQSFSN